MERIFRKLPLPAMLLTILLIPLALLAYLSFQLYQEKSQRVQLIQGYMNGINQSASINSVIDALQNERRASYDFAIRGIKADNKLLKRPQTDEALQKLETNNEGALAGFAKYTFLDQLETVRSKIDSGTQSPNEIMHYYTTAIFRLNLVNPVPLETDSKLKNLHKDLIGQRLLSEMITYLGIIRSNLYNVLYTRKFMLETLGGLRGVHEVYGTYEHEFLQKADPAAISEFKEIKNSKIFKPTIVYIDSLFARFRFDSSYTAESWWNASALAVDEMKKLQGKLWSNVIKGINEIFEMEKTTRNQTVILLFVALVAVISIDLYVISIITKSLREVKKAAEKISVGETGIPLKRYANDVIGALFESVNRIDENNKKLANAADAIGRGNFKTQVDPRSEQDILGNALVKMKHDLEIFNSEKDTLLLKKDEFMSIASHELKTPITSVKAALQIIERLTGNKPELLTIHDFVGRANKQVNKLTSIVNDLLDITKIQSGKLELNTSEFKINELISESIEQLHYALQGHEINLVENLEGNQTVVADRHRIEQVMVNMLSNAIKYSPGANAVNVKVEGTNECYKISVQDFGIGIAREKIPFIFDRFFRVEESSQNFSGLGLGLFISSEIVKRHHGEIGVLSDLGNGSTFWFTIPKATHV